MNAPAPAPIDAPQREATPSNRCPGTQLAVPECSCQSCLTRLMRAHAPGLLSAEAI